MAKVRVDFFRTNGAWYTTEMVEWSNIHKWLPKAFADSLYRHLKLSVGGWRLDDMVAVCLTPDHECQQPIMINTGELSRYLHIDDSGAAAVAEEEAPHGFSNSDEIIFGY